MIGISFKKDKNQTDISDLKFAKQFILSTDDLTHKIPATWNKKKIFSIYNLFFQQYHLKPHYITNNHVADIMFMADNDALTS